MQPNDLVEPYWEQQPGESETEFTYYLFFRGLGPTRTLQGAYEAYCYSSIAAEDAAAVRDLAKEVQKGASKRRTPGNWQLYSKLNLWDLRAALFDIDILSASGRDIIQSFYSSLAVFASQVLELFRSGDFKPKTYEELMYGLEILARFVSPEAVAAWREFAGGSNKSKLSDIPAAAPTTATASSVNETRPD